jgi:hypothetical protein
MIGSVKKIYTDKVDVGKLNTDNLMVFNPQRVNGPKTLGSTLGVPKHTGPKTLVSSVITPNRIDILNKSTVRELLHKPH